MAQCFKMTNLYVTKNIFLPRSLPCNLNRFVSTLKAATAVLDGNVIKSIDSNEIKPKKHPGHLYHGPFSLPKNVKNSISKLMTGVSRKQLLEESKEFKKYLLARDTPVEKHNLVEKTRQIEAEVEQSMNVQTDLLTEDELKKYNELKNIKVKQLLKQRVYHWSRLDFTDYLSLLYLITRSDAEYATISQVLTEIKTRSSFTPKTVFDFGSGVGTVVWAAHSIWGDSISEYYCVDSSSPMITLSENIIEASYGKKLNQSIFHRQFLPSSTEVSSDLVVCAYSLLELPSRSARLETIKNLWTRTTKYLVLIELGTKAGFKVLNEARDYVLSEDFNDENNSNRGHVFAPCPHDSPCPRSLKGKNICYFPATYACFPQKPETLKIEPFSYVVFEKGSRKSAENWPRLVQPVLNRSKHVICRFCTSSGDLKEVIFTPTKHGKATYKCARSSRWGDLLPCTLREKENHEVSNEVDSS